MQIGLGKQFINNNLGLYGKEGCQLAFVPIHKNAHTWAVEFFDVNYNFYKLPDLTQTQQKDLKYIVFLRDPITRWYSGVVQFLVDSLYNDIPDSAEVVLDDKLIKTLFSSVRVDAHTDLQRRYIMDLNIMDIYFFNIEDSMFYYKLTKLLNTTNQIYNLQQLSNGSNHILIEKNNQTEDKKLKVLLMKQLKQAADRHPEYLRNVNNFYRPDYELLQWMNRFAYAK